MSVNKSQNFYHDDIIYPNKPLIYSTAKMFTHYLSYFHGLTRKYHCYDLVLDTPKSKLYDKASNYTNEKLVYRDEKKLRTGLKCFMNNPTVRHLIAGGYANFEHTVFRPSSNYAKFHPHVHLTLMLPSNKALPSRQLSQLWSQCISTKYNHFHAQPTYMKSRSYHDCVKAYWPTLKYEHNQLITQKGNLIAQITSNRSNSKTMSALNGVNYELHNLPSNVLHYARPISNLDSHADIMSSMMHLGKESNKKRATFVAYNKSMSKHDYHTANLIASKHHLQHAMGAVYIGLSRFKSQFPRHAYFGKFHQYAQQHLYSQFPQEAQADKIHYTSSITYRPQLQHPNFQHSKSWQNIVNQVHHNFQHIQSRPSRQHHRNSHLMKQQYIKSQIYTR